MRKMTLFIVTLFGSLCVLASTNAATSKESVTLEISADLLKRARAMKVDLASVLEKQLKVELGGAASATPASRMALMTETFDNFEAMMLAPAEITTQTPTAEVRKVCQGMIDRSKQLRAHAEARKSIPLPTSLEEAKKLDDYLASRFKAFQARAAKVGKNMQAVGKVMKAKCADLEQDEKAVQVDMKAALAGYGPVGWCRKMMRTPRAQWTMEDGGTFAKFCPGVKPN